MQLVGCVGRPRLAPGRPPLLRYAVRAFASSAAEGALGSRAYLHAHGGAGDYHHAACGAERAACGGDCDNGGLGGGGRHTVHGAAGIGT